MFHFPFHSPTNEYNNVDSISEYFSVCPRTHVCVCVCVCIPHSPLEVLFPITGTLPVLSGPAIICGWAFNDCIVCVCVSFRMRSAIVAIRENLWVHIQCICRFACFSRHGRIHGTLCVCASVCMGILSVSAFGTNVQVCACMCEHEVVRFCACYCYVVYYCMYVCISTNSVDERGECIHPSSTTSPWAYESFFCVLLIFGCFSLILY